MPADKDPISYVWGELVPKIGPAAAKFSAAVYAHSSLALPEFEATRLRIAQIDGCVFCQDWRTERDGVQVDAGFDDAFWERMSAHYSQAEIVELTMCLGSWLAFGRLNRVLGLDTACVLPGAQPVVGQS